MKDSKLYYSITEVSEILGVPASTIRYWEKEFNLKIKRRGTTGNRQLTSQDINKLREIKRTRQDIGLNIPKSKERLSTRAKSKHHYEKLKEELIQLRKELIALKSQL